MLTIPACLRLNGTSAREHPVYRELARVKQYFEKIKLAESGDQRPNLRLDQAAAGRIIRHALVSRNINFLSKLLTFSKSQQASRGAEQGGKSDRGQNAQPSSEVHSRKRKADELEVHEPVVTSPGVESKAQNQLIANSEKKYEAQNAVTSSPEAKSEIQNKVVPTQGIKAKGSSSDSSCGNEDVSVPKGRKGQVQAAKVLKGLETGASKSSDPSRHTSESRKHKKTKQDRKKQQAEMVSSETPVDKPKKKKRKKSKSSKDALSD